MLIPQTKRGITVFIPSSYLIYENNIDRPKGKYEDNICANPPTIKFVTFNTAGNPVNKWLLEFESSDSGGYDTQTFQYYFNTLKDMFDFLMKED